jgi:hypothetical protein
MLTAIDSRAILIVLLQFKAIIYREVRIIKAEDIIDTIFNIRDYPED